MQWWCEGREVANIRAPKETANRAREDDLHLHRDAVPSLRAEGAAAVAAEYALALVGKECRFCYRPRGL